MTFGRRIRILAVLTLLLVVPAASAAGAQPPQAPAQEGFVPVDQLPPDEQLPAAPLLIAAYAIAWAAVLAYLWSIWRRLSRVERDLDAVSRRLETGARR